MDIRYGISMLLVTLIEDFVASIDLQEHSAGAEAHYGSDQGFRDRASGSLARCEEKKAFLAT